MKKTKLLALILAFLMLITSVGVFAEDTTEDTTQNSCELSQEAKQLRDNIAQILAETEDVWTAFDMALYQKLPDATVAMSDEIEQAVIDVCIDTAVAENAQASDLAKSEIVLRSLGIDSDELCTSNGEAVSNAEVLFNADHTASGHYSVPWVLLANLQGNLNLSDEQISELIGVLEQNSAGGTFGYEWEGVSYPDPDTAAAVLASLAPLRDTNDSADALCDEILTSFESMISESGSFGSANSDAFVIIGLLAIGENPADFTNETSGKSVVDGLLSNVNETNNGFTYYGAENFMATEQGFRALVALSLYEGNALNIYDFSDAEVVPGRHSEAPQETPEPEQPENPDEPETPVEPEAPEDTEEEESNSGGGILGGGGNTIGGSFLGGGTSGGSTSKPSKPAEPEKVEKEEEAEETPEEKPEEKPTPVFSDTANHWAKESIDYVAKLGIMNGVEEGKFAPEEKLTRGMVVTMLYRLSGEAFDGKNNFADVSDDAWYVTAANWASEKGIATGYGDSVFAADDRLTREQLVVMLYRFANAEVSSTEGIEFADGDTISDWAKDAAVWAKQNNIISGRDDGSFAPADNATRAEIAAVFMRFCKNVLKQG